MPTSANPLFKPGTRELLPATRDAYLKNDLLPADARQVESLLATDSVERRVALARYHELAVGPGELHPPQWVRQQLLRQPSVSAWGPLRRPVVQLVLGLLLGLGTWSAVQWVRNQPLVPVPVVLAFKRTVNSASQGLGQPVVYTPANIEATAALAEPPPAAPPARPAKPAYRRIARVRPAGKRTLLLVAAPQPAESAASPSDSVSQGSSGVGAVATLPEARRVRGHVYDQVGSPLVGATVLVKGSSRAAVTDARGIYELLTPPGTTLEVGYAGYTDEIAQIGQDTLIDVTLQPLGRRERIKIKK